MPAAPNQPPTWFKKPAYQPGSPEAMPVMEPDTEVATRLAGRRNTHCSEKPEAGPDDERGDWPSETLGGGGRGNTVDVFIFPCWPVGQAISPTSP